MDRFQNFYNVKRMPELMLHNPAGPQVLIHRRRDFSAENVIHFERHIAVCSYIKPDSCRRVEWVGQVLMLLKSIWQNIADRLNAHGIIRRDEAVFRTSSLQSTVS
jgi:hypothetical protein